MWLAFQLAEPADTLFAATIAAWDEALASVPEARLDDAYAAAYRLRLEDAPQSDYPLKALELLRAYRALVEEESAARFRRAEADGTGQDYYERMAAIATRAAAVRRLHPGVYAEPATVPPPPWELGALPDTRIDPLLPRMTRSEFIALALATGTERERRAADALSTTIVRGAASPQLRQALAEVLDRAEQQQP